MSRVPNLFVVGAPKSGTSALCHYLGQHPEVFMAQKELHHFGSDLGFRKRARPDRAAYLEAFTGALNERWFGDASVWYLFSSKAATEIHDASPDARVIAMLRNPVDMLYSLHSELVFQGDEDILGFEEALAAEVHRSQGERIPAACDSPWALRYTEVVRYSNQLVRYFDVFGRENVHTVIFDDFVADVALAYGDVLEFLGIDVGFRPDFLVVNANREVRSRSVQALLRQPPQSLRRISRLLLPSRSVRRALGMRLWAANADHHPRPTMDPSLRHRLEKHLAGEIGQLEDLLGCDLSSWSTSPLLPT